MRQPRRPHPPQALALLLRVVRTRSCERPRRGVRSWEGFRAHCCRAHLSLGMGPRGLHGDRWGDGKPPTISLSVCVWETRDQGCRTSMVVCSVFCMLAVCVDAHHTASPQRWLPPHSVAILAQVRNLLCLEALGVRPDIEGSEEDESGPQGWRVTLPPRPPRERLRVSFRTSRSLRGAAPRSFRSAFAGAARKRSPALARVAWVGGSTLASCRCSCAPQGRVQYV